MRNGVSEVKEEGVVFVNSDEVRRHRREKVMGILAFFAVKIGLKGPEEIISIELGEIIIVGVSLAQVAKPFIETLLLRSARSVSKSQAPFAHYAIGVTGAFQDFCYCHVFRLQ